MCNKGITQFLLAAHTRTIVSVLPSHKATAHWPVPSCTAWWQRHIVWETCPEFLRVVPGWDSNLRPLNRKSDTTATPRRHQPNPSVVDPLLDMTINSVWTTFREAVRRRLVVALDTAWVHCECCERDSTSVSRQSTTTHRYASVNLCQNASCPSERYQFNSQNEIKTK